MKITSTELKLHLGKYLLQAMQEPVFICKKNAEAVLLSKKEYDKLQNFEDAYWLNEIKKAEDEGYIGVEESMAKLKNAFNKS